MLDSNLPGKFMGKWVQSKERGYASEEDEHVKVEDGKQAGFSMISRKFVKLGNT